MITPLTSIQIPRNIASAIRIAMTPTIIMLETIGAFWTTWSEIYGR